MSFFQSCLATTFFIVSSVLVSQDNHVGTKLLGGVILIGGLGLGVVLGGCTVSMLRQVPCAQLMQTSAA